jgi:DNA-binding NarL/FixJ family response regulator
MAVPPRPVPPRVAPRPVPPRVALVEDHILLAETLYSAHEQWGVSTVVIAPEPHADLLDTILAEQPELVLLDLDLAEFGDSSPLIAPLVNRGVRVLVVTGTTDELRIAAALEQGAIGVQRKSSGFEALQAKALAALSATGPLDPGERARLLEMLTQARRARDSDLAPFRSLTDREQDTLRALARGESVREIAQNWYVSEATVRSHVRGVLSKLGAPSQLAAVAAASRSGWLDAAG